MAKKKMSKKQIAAMKMMDLKKGKKKKSVMGY